MKVVVPALDCQTWNLSYRKLVLVLVHNVSHKLCSTQQSSSSTERKGTVNDKRCTRNISDNRKSKNPFIFYQVDLELRDALIWCRLKSTQNRS